MHQLNLQIVNSELSMSTTGPGRRVLAIVWCLTLYNTVSHAGQRNSLYNTSNETLLSLDETCNAAFIGT